ncbi:MAG: hypothetical protein ACOC33_00155 [bacterium]
MSDLNKKLFNFLDKKDYEDKEEEQEKVFIKERDGLIERVDKKFITKDGKQLLRG